MNTQDPVVSAYNRAYKTHYAQIKYKTMTQAWGEQARALKDEVVAGARATGGVCRAGTGVGVLLGLARLCFVLAVALSQPNNRQRDKHQSNPLGG